MGRRFGLIQDATIMFVGLLMLTAAWGVTLSMYQSSTSKRTVC
jgi:hypothetical protein